MYICVLSSPTDEPGVIGYDPAPYLNGYKWTHIVPDSNNIEGDIKRMLDQGVDVFLNMCAGSADDPLLYISSTLLDMNVAFTGSYGHFFDPPRAEMKDAALAAGIPFPASVFADTHDEVQRAAETLKFPLLVKPPHGYASVGIRKESRVTNAEELHAQAELTLQEFGSILIEEFIEGRELTCLACENLKTPSRPYTFRAMEYLFPEGESFKHVDMKWTHALELVPRPVTDKALDRKLRNYTARLFKTMKGNGYARVDYRMNADGDIFMLEINPNCGIFDDLADPACADHILMNDPVGHKGFMDLILKNAFESQARRNGHKK